MPANNVAEVTLLGTGGGYGESCVIHYGNNHWAVVDSCENPNNKKSLPLSYLKNLGVGVESAVKLVICTHWHNDHIRGLTQVVEECKTADFCFARATDIQKFLFWVGLDYQKAKDNPSISSTSEFVECLKIIKAEKRRVISAAQDRMLDNIPVINTSISSLSPSDFVLEQFDLEISTMIEKFGTPQRKFVYQSPNDKSVVLFLKLGLHNVILGADLEVCSDNQRGWLNILDYSTALKGTRSSLFKIPHHGSSNGYHHRIWKDLLQPNPVAKLTPWNRNNRLPDASMIQVYKSHSSKLFITSPVVNSTKPKKREKDIEKIISFFTKKLVEIKYDQGIIRSRITIDDPNSIWTTDLEGESFKI